MQPLARIVLLTLICCAANAETLYVNDKLVVGVYPEMESENGKLANLETGDAVEELERQDKYVRVRLSDGREGWVRANYLSAQPPAIVRLKELQAAGGPAAGPSPQMTQELTQLKDQNASLQKEVAALKQTAAAQPAVVESPRIAAVPEPMPEPVAAPIAVTAAPHFVWAGGALLAAVLGFLLGYQTLARRIRRKYGSVRIY
jgi:SH3 domain protein